ncbi:MAG: hypothetical protein HYW05_04825 [Candidatus Diapherotrites archaeon]|nr:hypothetical protein [Candidatus Diapherotrites archaeon]
MEQVWQAQFYPDTNYIYGGFKKLAIELKKKDRKRFKTEIKDFEQRQKLIDKGIKFIISELTEFEIKNSLMNEEGLTFSQANHIFQRRIVECPIYTKIAIKSVNLDYTFINWALQHKFGLNDAFHILIATKLKLIVITKERNIEKWQKAYHNVWSAEQFQDYVRKL